MKRPVTKQLIVTCFYAIDGHIRFGTPSEALHHFGAKIALAHRLAVAGQKEGEGPALIMLSRLGHHKGKRRRGWEAWVVNKPPPMLSCALLAWCQEGVRLRAHTSVALPVAYFSGKHPLTAWNCFHEAPRTPCLRGPNIGPFGSKFRHVWTR